MYNTEKVKPAPTSWAPTWEADSPYAGSVTAYDNAIFIADAALYLKATQPDLGIENPYALDEEQLAAAKDLLMQQKDAGRRVLVGLHQDAESFVNGDTIIGTTWQVITNLAQGERCTRRGDPAGRGLDRLVGHLDGGARLAERELCLRVGEPRDLARDAGADRRVVR